jgi:hypothetical protein
MRIHQVFNRGPRQGGQLRFTILHGLFSWRKGGAQQLRPILWPLFSRLKDLGAPKVKSAFNYYKQKEFVDKVKS